MKDAFQMVVFEKNETKTDGMEIVELYGADASENCYQILIGKNTRSDRMIVRVNSVDKKKTLYSGEVYILDFQEILPGYDCFIFAVKDAVDKKPFCVVNAIPRRADKNMLAFVVEVPASFFEV